MGDAKKSLSSGSELSQALDALSKECMVTDCQHFVYQEVVWINMNRDSES